MNKEGTIGVGSLQAIEKPFGVLRPGSGRTVGSRNDLIKSVHAELVEAFFILFQQPVYFDTCTSRV